MSVAVSLFGIRRRVTAQRDHRLADRSADGAVDAEISHVELPAPVGR
jgi:hypothetical protein